MLEPGTVACVCIARVGLLVGYRVGMLVLGFRVGKAERVVGLKLGTEDGGLNDGKRVGKCEGEPP